MYYILFSIKKAGQHICTILSMKKTAEHTQLKGESKSLSIAVWLLLNWVSLSSIFAAGRCHTPRGLQMY